ncbi:MAG: amidohydrolase family protein [Phycisphaerae bacterium]|nr:amidohydrolase family protein [Phycisphaerae bacterium]
MSISGTIHLYNGKILVDPEKVEFCSSITIQNGVVTSLDEPLSCDALSVDLQGATAVPGFIDSHLHLVLSATGLGIDLSGCTSKEDFVETLEVLHEEDSAWGICSRWNDERLGEMPAMSWIPKSIKKPIICYRVDLHSALLNEEALALLDRDRLRVMPGGSRIDEGFVMEDVLFEEVLPLIPELPLKEKIACMKRAISLLHKHGITSVGTMERLEDVQTILQPLQEDQLMRFYVICLDQPSEVFCAGRNVLNENEYLAIIGMKSFLDGSFGSRTAKMYEEWCDASGCGEWAGHASKGGLNAWVAQVTELGLAPVLHAIGDEAVGKALRAIDGLSESVHARIEHAQSIAERDVLFLKNKWFGVQPLHFLDEEIVAGRALGTKRALEMHNWRRMLDAGAHLSFGSDWPVAPPIPIDAMAVAIRCGVTPIEALVATTQNAARSLQSTRIGNLGIDAMGDVVVLDKNPLNCDWKKEKPSVTMTIQAGNVVFTKDGSSE